jgi:hypothetical protein
MSEDHHNISPPSPNDSSTQDPPEPETPTSSVVEEFSLSGDDLVAKIKELIEESNVRRIAIKNQEGQVLIEIPLTVGVTAGVIGAALFPVLAAVGAIGALVAKLKIVVERVEP